VVVEVLEVVIVVLIINLVFKVVLGLEVILVVYTLMVVVEAVHGIVMDHQVEVVVVKDMPDITFQVQVLRGWEIMEVLLLDKVVAVVEEKEVQVKHHPILEVMEVELIILQVKDSLSIIGKVVEVLVEQIGIMHHPQDLM
jgi:hypothetical protein